MSFKLVNLTDQHMTRESISLPRKKFFYPSEASVRWINTYGIPVVSGTCLRRSYYRCSGTVPSSPKSAYSEWIFALGKKVEEILVEQWKQMGIWVGNNLKFFDEERRISGEVDVLIKDPETEELVGVEVKSIYGYQARRDVIGNSKIKGQPKTSQLLQTLIYVDQCKDLGINYFKMVYYARDSADRTEYDIRLIEDSSAGEVIHRPSINGQIDYRFTLEDIYDRYSLLAHYLEKKEVPPRDFSLVYSPEEVEKRWAVGEISKTAYANYKKNPKKYPVGDWQCSYCPFTEVCYPKK